MVAEGEVLEQVMIDAIHLELYCTAAGLLRGAVPAYWPEKRWDCTVSCMRYVLTQAAWW